MDLPITRRSSPSGLDIRITAVVITATIMAVTMAVGATIMAEVATIMAVMAVFTLMATGKD